MDSILQCLADFEAISLEETNQQAALLRRVDTKFVFSVERLPFLLQLWKQTHRALEVEGIRLSNYHSVYWDTPDLALYRAHHAGAASRIKLRLREYVESDLRFFEVKVRNNKGVTDKERKRLKESGPTDELMNRYAQFDERHLKDQLLKVSLEVNYRRITLVPRTGTERVTIDLDLSYRVGEQTHSMGPMVVVEVKTDRSVRSGVLRQLKQAGFRSGSISKYCLGILHLYPTVKRNRFKQPLRIINKQIRNHGPAADRNGSPES
ncbi:MAG: polyphosphate polymerase domain-containing protein [Bacteroidota bacterium]